MLPGVYRAYKKDKTEYFRANITYHCKHISLGSYTTEKEAHKAYMEAWALLNGEDTLDGIVEYYLVQQLEQQAESFRMQDIYSHPDADGASGSWESAIEKWSGNRNRLSLGFDKCISLLNFRDHQLYIANPIYMRKNYFSYFLSPSVELKFDIDDLFYYSRHKIMRRQGHLFVSDYGMQVTILSRYGLKSHAVCGRDYTFANGDTTDLRYSNIIVINHYHGVQMIEKNGKRRYRARIHINGNYLIGIYPTEERAAVAYNKAVDCVKKAGLTRNYPENYIESLSAEEYAAMYEQVRISDRLLSYLSCGI